MLINWNRFSGIPSVNNSEFCWYPTTTCIIHILTLRAGIYIKVILIAALITNLGLYVTE